MMEAASTSETSKNFYQAYQAYQPLQDAIFKLAPALRKKPFEILRQIP
jgi:Ser/Thr protein kinase RdoA (MazF antagonist)